MFLFWLIHFKQFLFTILFTILSGLFVVLILYLLLQNHIATCCSYIWQASAYKASVYCYKNVLGMTSKCPYIGPWLRYAHKEKWKKSYISKKKSTLRKLTHVAYAAWKKIGYDIGKISCQCLSFWTTSFVDERNR